MTERTPGEAIELSRLMLVTDRHVTAGRDLVDVIEDACRGGLRLIQLRERDLPADAIAELVEDLRAVVPADVTLLVNGRPDLAVELGCGVHLSSAAPQPDLVLPQPWGRAVHDEEEARRALSAGAGYLVAGTIYPTPSKPGFAGRGLAFVEAIVDLADPVPVFAIGGIELTRVAEVRAAGAHGIAVRRAILEAASPAEAARRLLAAAERAPSGRTSPRPTTARSRRRTPADAEPAP